MKKSVFAWAVASVMALGLPQAYAAGMTFKIHNDSDYIINGFYVSDEDGNLSPNWMNFELDGGESADMQFDYDGPCDIYFVVDWLAEDGSSIQGDLTSIDICNANNIYFDGEEAYYD